MNRKATNLSSSTRYGGLIKIFIRRLKFSDRLFNLAKRLSFPRSFSTAVKFLASIKGQTGGYEVRCVSMIWSRDHL